MDGRIVEQGVDGVEAQPVNVVVAQPHQGVVDEVAAHFVAAGTVEVDGIAPGRLVVAGEVGAVDAQVVAIGPEVVVDHVEDHGEATLVAGVDQCLQPRRAAVEVVGRVEIDAVVAPAA